MKRAVAGIVVALVMGGTVPATAAPGAGAGADQFALAAWVEMHGDKGKIVAADAFRFLYDGELHTLGGVMRGTCRRARMDGWVFISCTATGRMKEVGLDGFQMDPALRSAALEVTSGGRTHEAEWTGKDPWVSQGLGGGAGAVVVGAGAEAWASATGTIFGQKYSKRCWFCLIGEGAVAGVFTGTRAPLELESGNRSLRLGADGETLELELTRKFRV